MSGTTLYFTEQGDGQPLIVIHGLFGSSRNWQGLARQWAKRCRVICVDLRNHGRSFHNPEMNYPVMAQDVFNLMDALGISRCDILGHSMGGKVAMKMAHEQPERLKRMIVADIAPVGYVHNYFSLIRPVMAMDLVSIKSRRAADEILSADIQDTALRQFILQSLEVDDAGARWRINWTAIEQYMLEITGFEKLSDWQISVPSLFVRGSSSEYMLDDSIRLIKRHFINCQFKTIQGAGHWIHAEKPVEFKSVVEEFLFMEK